jgi:hypothetical protein
MFGAVHFWARGMVARRVARGLSEEYGEVDLDLKSAFLKGTRWFRTIFRATPTGWSGRTETRLRALRDTVAGHIQSLNDRYADPSAKPAPDPAPEPLAVPEPEPETLEEKRETGV